MSALSYSERAATGTPRGLLVLHHGRGANEHDLLGLAEVLDPAGELHVVAPRAPLTLPGWSGYHWYVVPRVGYPDPDTFTAAYEQLAALHDELWARTGVGPEQTVLGGFSMGAVMSYALALGEDRPRPRGILALSGFIPTVPGWAPALATSEGLKCSSGMGAEMKSSQSTSLARRVPHSHPRALWSNMTSPPAATPWAPSARRGRRGGLRGRSGSSEPPPVAETDGILTDTWLHRDHGQHRTAG